MMRHLHSIEREQDGRYVITGEKTLWLLLLWFGPNPFVWEGEYDAQAEVLRVREVTRKGQR